MTKIKICGLSRQEDIDIVNEALPDYVGFVFAESRRQIDGETASEFRKRLNPAVKAVGVFVNEDIKHIIRLCDANTIDLVQLHGEEDEAYIKQLKSRVPHKIIKAVRVRGAEDLEGASHTDCDYLLLDAYKRGRYGGSGEVFDWSVIPRIEKPFFLAGGIRGGNVTEAIVRTHPYAVDVSSGVETGGFKDAVKIKEIVAKVRSATESQLGLKTKSFQ